MKLKIAAASAVIALTTFFVLHGMGERSGPKYAPESDTVSYRIDTISMVSDDSLVALRVSYPVITEENEKLSKILNGSIEPILFTLLFPGYNDDALLIDQLHNRFNELERERHAVESAASWYLTEEVEIVHNRNGVLSTSFSTEQYTGGAHGNHSVLYLSSEFGNGIEEITLSHLFSDDDRLDIDRIGERHFRRVRHLSDTANLTQEGFWFENGKFTLTDNFAVIPEGLVFHYNSYTIAPYALGETELIIPFGELEPYLEEHTLRYW